VRVVCAKLQLALFEHALEEGLGLGQLALSEEPAFTEIPFKQLEFLETLGAGSFGTVHAGRLFGSEVAIKRFQLVTAASAPVLVASMCRSRARGQRARRNGRLEERAQRVGARRAAELALL
jgi:hypothetical protein